MVWYEDQICLGLFVNLDKLSHPLDVFFAGMCLSLQTSFYQGKNL